MTKIKLIAPEDNSVISFTTEVQKAYHSAPERLIPHPADPEPRKTDDTIPVGAVFAFEADAECELQISEYEDFREYLSFSGKNEFKVSNLLHGRKYFWQVKCGGQSSEKRSFTVAMDLPRWINIPDVTNVRDIGGWKTSSGREIRQGMVFRGGQFEGWTNQSHRSAITEEGRRVFLDELKIHTEIDLRGEGKGQVFDVPDYQKIPIEAYATWNDNGIFAPEQMDNVRKIFELFADEKTYPLYFHCQGGGDRTGTIAFLLEAVLGMDYNDMITDYEMTNLSVSGERNRYSEVWTKFIEKLATFAPEKSVYDQTAAFLNQCGIKDDVLEKIRTILLF